MVRVTGPLFSNQARGILADTLLFRAGGRAHSVYPYRKPKWPNTMSQQNRHTLFSLLAARWADLTTIDKKFWAPYATCSCITLYNAYLAYNLPRLSPHVLDGLIGWWPGISPTGGTLHDLSPEGNHGTWFGPVNHWADSRYRLVQSYQAPTAYVTVGDLPLYEFAGDFTIAYRYFSTSDANMTTVSKWTGVGSGSHWWIHSLATEIKAGVYTKDPSVTIFDANMSSATDRWRHVALVRDGSVGHLYVDGVDKDTKACSPSDAGKNAAPLTFGNYNGATGGWPYDGLLHDIRLYDRALSPGEVGLIAP